MNFEDIEKALDRTVKFTNEDFESLGLPDNNTIEKNYTYNEENEDEFTFIDFEKVEGAIWMRGIAASKIIDLEEELFNYEEERAINIGNVVCEQFNNYEVMVKALRELFAEKTDYVSKEAMDIINYYAPES